LVFSKYEEFAEELSYLPLEYWRPEYQGLTSEEAPRFIEKQYLDLIEGKGIPFMTHRLRPGQKALTLGMSQETLALTRTEAEQKSKLTIQPY
jgi:hypothetical protein